MEKKEPRKKDTQQYEDIIHLPHHQSARRPRMPLMDRAAQFAPFSALEGYEEVLKGILEERERQE